MPQSIWILDIDRTLADDNYRWSLFNKSHEDMTSSDWEQYFHPSLVLQDTMIPAARKGLIRLSKLIRHDPDDHVIIFLTSRPIRISEPTKKWLRRNVLPILPGVKRYLIMRPKHDERPRAEFKADWLKKLSLFFKGASIYYIDDESDPIALYPSFPGKFFLSPKDWSKFPTESV